LTILVTGCAGFIGAHLARRLVADGRTVVGLDDFNAYYDPDLKEARVRWIHQAGPMAVHRIGLEDADAMAELFAATQPRVVVHLAAQAGVRHSIEDPASYVRSNLVGFANLIEGCRQHEVQHLVYASTSSVYGLGQAHPYRENQTADQPMSFYAATKRADEMMAHSYAHLYGLPCTGLRFFTVYGPWGRPDMALFKFTRAMLAGEPIDIYNHGQMQRDWTYVDDIIEGVVRVMDQPAAPDPGWSAAAPTPGRSSAPSRIYNIGADQPVELMRFIEVLEASLGVSAERKLLPMQPGDVAATWADVSALEAAVGYRPQVSVEEGVPRFVAWYRDYYSV
jgi:UDP-glucuronate 4-epimerase